MSPWHSRLQLQFSFEASRTVLRHQHEGGLRALASHYPEAPGICHQVLVHPPGGDEDAQPVEEGEGAAP